MVPMFRDPRALLSGLPKSNSAFKTLNWARSMALVPIPRSGFKFIIFRTLLVFVVLILLSE